MPRGDGQGPMNDGPMTGRAMGYCAGYDAPGFETAPGGRLGLGRGIGRGYSRGRGFRGAGFGRATFGPGYGRGLGLGRRYGAPYRAGLAPGYPGAGAYPAAPENQRAMLQEEIDELNERITFLKRELDATGTGEGENS